MSEITPAAIAAILDNQFPADEIASALAEMRASGAYDHDVARGVAMRVGDASQGRVVLDHVSIEIRPRVRKSARRSRCCAAQQGVGEQTNAVPRPR